MLALVGHFLIEKLPDHDVRAPILGMYRELAIQRCIPILFRTALLPRISIKSIAWESRLMRDALTIVVVHVSRQQRQSPLNVGQCLRLKAGVEIIEKRFAHNRAGSSNQFIGVGPGSTTGSTAIAGYRFNFNAPSSAGASVTLVVNQIGVA